MIRKFTFVAIALALAFLFSGCNSQNGNGITQVATIDALLTGVYDGHMSLETLRSYGDFGIGTFEGLDGEMILLNGTFYKVRSDGKVYLPPLSERTPFASVTKFVPDHKKSLLEPIDMKELEAAIDNLAPEQNRFVAFIVHGAFRHVKTRNVPAQKKPYPPLSEVAKTQPVFTLSNVRGTLIGFRSPAFVQGINVPGYHIHFLADDLSGGGHVLELEMSWGVLEADTVHQWLHLYLPSGSASFDAADLTRDRSSELNAVEKQ